VVTLWYRPPELLLGSSTYGPSIDIWGAGCIIAELWIRSPILQVSGFSCLLWMFCFEGNTEQEQLQRISKLCGSMNPESWPGIEQMPLYGKLNQNGLHNAVPQNYPRRVRERIGPFLKVKDGLNNRKWE
jgi:cyclin-dependent kinase 9